MVGENDGDDFIVMNEIQNRFKRTKFACYAAYFTMSSVFSLPPLLFGAVHLGHGFMYMAGAIVLLGSLGGMYEKQRNIWGVTIIHYVMGEAGTCLGFIL